MIIRFSCKLCSKVGQISVQINNQAQNFQSQDRQIVSATDLPLTDLQAKTAGRITRYF